MLWTARRLFDRVNSGAAQWDMVFAIPVEKTPLNYPKDTARGGDGQGTGERVVRADTKDRHSKG